jgi:two-component system, OmpR family, phosphate regulon sensor histidine kinase PhoR
MRKQKRGKRDWSERLLYFAIVPATVIAVVGLGAAALRTTLQIEKARQQAVFDATMSLAKERVDRLDRMIVAQDNAVIANVDVGHLGTIRERWLRTANRETPTVRAVLVVDLAHRENEVRAFVSRAAGPDPDDERFRRLVVSRIVPMLDLDPEPADELRHLHHAFDGQSYLVSYWQRAHEGHPYLVIAWHDVQQLVQTVMPELYRDLDRNSRMNVIDEQGRIQYGPPVQAGRFTVGLQFPTTLWKWSLQVALTSAEDLERRAVRERYLQLLVVGLAALIAAAGVITVARAYVNERQLAALKSDFVANVSHELKTPLASVRMFGEMLLSKRVSSEAKQREYLQIIVGESERLTNLIDNVLDFAKVERGSDAYHFEPGDVVEIVRLVVDSLRFRAEQQKVELRVATEPCTAVFDASALSLAVANMVDNALKYAKGTEWIEVRVGPATPEPTGPNGESAVRIRIADHGPGIDHDEQSRVFERFVRGRVAYEHRVRGSGIGLALVKHIAEAHGGKVTVQSPIEGSDRGTAFVIALPALPPRYRAPLVGA